MMENKESINSYKLFKSLNQDKVFQSHSRPVIVADNLRTPENMGSVLRLAANAGAQKVYFIKYNNEQPRNWKIKKTASGADEKVEWSFISINELKKAIPKDYKYIAIETAETASNLYETKLPKKCVFIVGHEVYGIGNELMAMADKTVYIPIPGKISSLNVTHALAITLFEWLRQQFWNK